MAQVPLQSGSPRAVDILILGAGWLSQFLLPHLDASNLSYAATTRTGESHYPSIPMSSPLLQFKYDPSASVADLAELLRPLPDARTIVVTFPISVEGAATRLCKGWLKAKGGQEKGDTTETTWIQLGSTSVWKLDPSRSSQYFNRSSPIDPTNARGASESELLALDFPHLTTTVLNLAGLWGGERNMRNWVSRVAPDKETLRTKGGLHMVHGKDVSRAITLVHKSPELLSSVTSSSSSKDDSKRNRRWILTDTHVYDWWDLATWWGDKSSAPPQRTWVRELMREEDEVVLPRAASKLGRVMDGREFWETFGESPTRRVE